jgi:hypothetical protein
MTLQAKLDAFKADFEAGKPPYNVPLAVIETMHRATAELLDRGPRMQSTEAPVAPGRRCGPRKWKINMVKMLLVAVALAMLSACASPSSFQVGQTRSSSAVLSNQNTLDWGPTASPEDSWPADGAD